MNHPDSWDQPIKWNPQNEALLDDPELELLLLRLHGCADLPEFWGATRSLLDALVPSDAALMYVNFQNFAKNWEASRVFVTPTADKPVGWMQKRRMVDLMPPYILSQPNLPLFRLSDICSDPIELQNTEFFRKYMEPDGWHYSACLLFWQGAGLHSEITIRRSDAQGDFTTAEMSLLARLRPHFATVLTRLVIKARRTIVQPIAAARPIGFKLDGNLPLRTMEPAAPRKIVGIHEPDRVHAPIDAPTVPREMAVERRREEIPRPQLTLSDKECVVLRLAAGGVSNGEISKSIGVTTHTVKWHLANVFVKLGVKNRTAAVRAALALGLLAGG